MLTTPCNPRHALRAVMSRSWRLIAWAVVFSGCNSDPTQPDPQVPQRIGEISFTTKVWWAASPPEGILYLTTRALDPAFRATADTRLRVDVRSSSGDVEQAFFKKRLCWDGLGHDARVCEEIIVAMEEGYHVQDLHSRLRALPGRYTTSPSIGWFAGIQLFGIGFEGATRKVRSWPGVRYVEQVASVPLMSETMPAEQWVGGLLEANMMLDVVTPVIGNGKIELLEGDTVTVRYIQPDSSVYTKSYVFPARQ